MTLEYTYVQDRITRKVRSMKIKQRYITYFLIVAITIFAVSAFAEIRVTAVKGNASYKLAGKWQPLKAGVVLAVGTKVSTGVRSTVDIKINKHSVTVYPLTIMKI